MKKILNIISDTGEAGLSILNVHQKIALALADNYSVTNLFLCGSPDKIPKNIPINKWPGEVIFLEGSFRALRKKSWYTLSFLALLRKLRKAINTNHYDTIICDGILSTNAILESGAHKNVTACYCIFHGFIKIEKKKFSGIFKAASTAFEKNWHFIAVSEPVKNDLEHKYAAFRNRVTCIENMVDAHELDATLLPRQQARERLGIDESAFVIGAIGRLSPEKGYDTLTEAFSLLQIPNAKLLIIGDGKERDNILAVARASNILDKLILPGRINGASNLLKAFDVFIMSSITEGSPLSLIEAMLAALPVVVSTAPSLQSILEDYPYTFETGNKHALASAIKALAEMPAEDRSYLGLRLRQQAKQRFSFETFQRKYLQAIASS